MVYSLLLQIPTRLARYTSHPRAMNHWLVSSGQSLSSSGYKPGTHRYTVVWFTVARPNIIFQVAVTQRIAEYHRTHREDDVGLKWRQMKWLLGVHGRVSVARGKYNATFTRLPPGVPNNQCKNQQILFIVSCYDFDANIDWEEAFQYRPGQKLSWNSAWNLRYCCKLRANDGSDLS